MNKLKIIGVNIVMAWDYKAHRCRLAIPLKRKKLKENKIGHQILTRTIR